MATHPISWREVLKFIITVLTAIAGALGMQSCL
jgi:hypothetical protein